MQIDTSELTAFAAHLASAPARTAPMIEAVTERGANNIKREARELLDRQSRRVYLRHYARSITYDMEVSGDTIAADIGPDSSMPQGGMGRGVEFGSANTGPIPHLFPAFDAEEPRYMHQLALAVIRGLR